MSAALSSPTMMKFGIGLFTEIFFDPIVYINTVRHSTMQCGKSTACGTSSRFLVTIGLEVLVCDFLVTKGLEVPVCVLCVILGHAPAVGVHISWCWLGYRTSVRPSVGSRSK